MELDERIKLEIDKIINRRNGLRLGKVFVGLTKEDMMMEDIEWISKKTKEIGLNNSQYLKYYFNELDKIC